jgi:hypothetical protein
LLLVDGDNVNDMMRLWSPGRHRIVFEMSWNPVLKEMLPDAECKVTGLEEAKAVELLLDGAKL